MESLLRPESGKSIGDFIFEDTPNTWVFDDIQGTLKCSSDKTCKHQLKFKKAFRTNSSTSNYEFTNTVEDCEESYSVRGILSVSKMN